MLHRIKQIALWSIRCIAPAMLTCPAEFTVILHQIYQVCDQITSCNSRKFVEILVIHSHVFFGHILYLFRMKSSCVNEVSMSICGRILLILHEGPDGLSHVFFQLVQGLVKWWCQYIKKYSAYQIGTPGWYFFIYGHTLQCLCTLIMSSFCKDTHKLTYW